MGGKDKKDPRKLPGVGRSKASSFSVAEVYAKNKIIFQALAVMAAVIFSFIVYQQSSASILNLTDASDETLKSVFTGDKPYIFYCARGQGKDEKVHPIFAELNKAQGTKYGFAMVNCYHKLPSGKTIMDRFALNKKMKPIIFMTAPWFAGRGRQATGGALRDVRSLKKHVETSLAPRAQEVATDKELAKYCGFGKSSFTTDEKSIGASCIAFVKGKRHAKQHVDLEERVIREFPRSRYVAIDANKRRLSFEDAESMPADSFALKVHALRNGTHHMSMVNPVTWDYTSTFVGHAVGTPLYDFEGDASTPVGIKKLAPSTSFRDRSAGTRRSGDARGEGGAGTGGSASTGDDDYEGDNMTKEQKKARRERLKAERAAGKNSGETGSDSQDGDPELSPEEAAALQAERERKAREYVEEMQRRNEIEGADPYEDPASGYEGGAEDGEEEELIEL